MIIILIIIIDIIVILITTENEQPLPDRHTQAGWVTGWTVR